VYQRNGAAFHICPGQRLLTELIQTGRATATLKDQSWIRSILQFAYSMATKRSVTSFRLGETLILEFETAPIQ
jgi:hypothetical protein